MTNKTKHVKSALLAASIAGVMALSGCSTDDADEAQIRVIHASPDAPAVNVLLDNNAAISNLDYADSSGYQVVDAGIRDVTVEAIIPGGNQDVITVDNLSLDKDSRNTIIAVDNTASIEAYVAEESAASPASGEVAVAVVHASPDAQAVDVYVTAPGTDVSDPNLQPNFTFDFKDPAVDAGALPADTYDITVTAAGTKTVAYNISGVDLSPFAGQKLLIAAISTTSATNREASPIKLLVATDDAQLVLLDEDTEAGARVVHLSPDADTAASGPVEVLANSVSLGITSLELIDAFSYTEIAPPVGNPPLPLTTDGSFVLVPPAEDFIFDVAIDEGAIVFTSDEIALSQGAEYTVIAAGYVSNTPAFDLLATVDSNRSIITQATVKVVHGAPAAGTVSVYVTPAGDFSKDDVENGLAGEPLLQNFEFGSITDYVAVPPGDYDIRVVPDALGVAAINVEGATLPAGVVATVIARQPNDPGSPSGTPDDFGLIVLTN
ncbi:MAG: DUF4397 domain-containing protein [Gammaproteobacteria bacterium]|jgi:hypothetical protein